jgi:hypothetical protein
MLEELLLDRVLTEPGDRAQPAGDRGAGSAAVFQIAGERLDVGAADREQRKRPGTAPGGELPQVQGVRLPGQAPVPGQVTGERESLGVGEQGLDGDEDSRRDGGGHRGTSQVKLRPGKLGQPRGPSINPIPAIASKPLSAGPHDQ